MLNGRLQIERLDKKTFMQGLRVADAGYFILIRNRDDVKFYVSIWDGSRCESNVVGREKKKGEVTWMLF